MPNYLRKGPTSTTGERWREQRPGTDISDERLSELVAQAQAIESLNAWDAKMVRYAGRCFVQANLPHSIRQIDQFATFKRVNGNYTLEIKPDSEYGIPYGTLPRLILIWIADEVRHHRRKEVFLGDSLSKFMQELGIVPTGGRWGTITRLRNQLLRLFNADIRFKTQDADGAQGALFSIQKYSMWWNRPSDPGQADLWRSTILLSDPLFEELLVHSAPVDMRAIKALRKSPMELDVYCWLTARMLTLKRPLHLDYETLREQFGAQYSSLRNFQVNIDKALWSVKKQYPAALVRTRYNDERGDEGWYLEPSPPHVPPRPKRLAK